MARLPIPITTTLEEPAIVWHGSRREDVRAFVQNWLEYPACRDGALPGEPITETPRYQTESLIYELMLEDMCAEQPENRVTYTQVIAALRAESQAVRGFGACIDQIKKMSCWVYGALKGLEKSLERQGFEIAA